MNTRLQPGVVIAGRFKQLQFHVLLSDFKIWNFSGALSLEFEFV
jgi:hypothetical protein